MELQEMPTTGYTLPTAARIIGIHDKSIYRLVREGKIDFYLDLTERMMISREELWRYLRERENGTVVSYVRH